MSNKNTNCWRNRAVRKEAFLYYCELGKDRTTKAVAEKFGYAVKYCSIHLYSLPPSISLAVCSIKLSINRSKRGFASCIPFSIKNDPATYLSLSVIPV